MKRIIKEISNHFHKKLNGKSSYTIGELSDLGFPDFLCESIQNTIHANIARELTLPSDTWTRLEADQVQQTKELLLGSLYDEANLSVHNAKNIIKDSITDILAILVEPRKNIPEIIFGDKDTLAKEAAKQKISKLTVYHHFARVLNSYLNQKERSSLTKEQCKQIITDVDEKLSAGYSPSQWAKLLEPLFILNEDRVTVGLFCLFFEDKEMPDKVQTFVQINRPIGRRQFTKILSADEQIFTKVLSSEETSEAKQTVQKEEDQTVQAEEEQTVQKEEDINNTTSKKRANFSPPSPVAESETNDQKPEARNQKNEKDAELESQNEAAAVNANASFDKDANKTRSVNEFFVTASAQEEESVSQADQAKRVQHTSDKSDNKPTDTAVPLWQRFSDDNDQANATANLADKTEKYEGANNFNLNENRKKQLKQQLGDKEEIYIDELFNGSKREFDKNIATLATKTQWEEAVSTIKNDIFEKNNVDIYSPAAVHFTNQLQKFFNEKL